MTIYEAIHTESDYHKAENVYAHAYRDSLTIIDLENAMRPGRECRRWAFYVSRSHMEANRLCLSEYIEMAAPECGSFAELIAHLRSGAALEEVEGLTVSIGSQKSSRTFSPFVAVKPVKLGERLNASVIARAILAGQIAKGETEGRYTDDYAADAAYDFYRGSIDLTAFAQDIYEHPQGWSFWWNGSGAITAACHTFDYKTLYVA